MEKILPVAFYPMTSGREPVREWLKELPLGAILQYGSKQGGMTAHTGQTVRVELPEPIFRRLRRIAEVTHRSVEDVLATTVDAALPQTSGVPAEVADELAAMTLFSDAALWTAATTTLSPEHQHRLNELTRASAAQPLTGAQAAELTRLIDTYDRAVLRRAKALALLAQRGHNVTSSASLDEHG